MNKAAAITAGVMTTVAPIAAALTLSTPWYVKAGVLIGAAINTRLGSSIVGVMTREDDMELSDIGLRDPIHLRQMPGWLDHTYTRPYFHGHRLVGGVAAGSLVAMLGFGRTTLHNWHPTPVPLGIRECHCVSMEYDKKDPVRSMMHFSKKPAPKAASLA